VQREVGRPWLEVGTIAELLRADGVQVASLIARTRPEATLRARALRDALAVLAKSNADAKLAAELGECVRAIDHEERELEKLLGKGAKSAAPPSAEGQVVNANVGGLAVVGLDARSGPQALSMKKATLGPTTAHVSPTGDLTTRLGEMTLSGTRADLPYDNLDGAPTAESASQTHVDRLRLGALQVATDKEAHKAFQLGPITVDGLAQETATRKSGEETVAKSATRVGRADVRGIELGVHNEGNRSLELDALKLGTVTAADGHLIDDKDRDWVDVDSVDFDLDDKGNGRLLLKLTLHGEALPTGVPLFKVKANDPVIVDVKIVDGKLRLKDVQIDMTKHGAVESVLGMMPKKIRVTDQQKIKDKIERRKKGPVETVAPLLKGPLGFNVPLGVNEVEQMERPVVVPADDKRGAIHLQHYLEVQVQRLLDSVCPAPQGPTSNRDGSPDAALVQPALEALSSLVFVRQEGLQLSDVETSTKGVVNDKNGTAKGTQVITVGEAHLAPTVVAATVKSLGGGAKEKNGIDLVKVESTLETLPKQIPSQYASAWLAIVQALLSGITASLDGKSKQKVSRIDRETLAVRLAANNLTLHPIVGNGNCLFEAVIDQLRLRGMSPHLAHVNTADDLRAALAAHLRRNGGNRRQAAYDLGIPKNAHSATK
jgi:hypothetical protein